MAQKNRSIEAFAIYTLKDERLPEEIPGLKLRPGQLRELLENLPVQLVDPEEQVDCQQSIDEFLGESTWRLTIGEAKQLEIDYNEGLDGINESPYRLEQPTELHKRSFVIEHPDFLKSWNDEYGHRYAAVTLKGNNFANPKIIEHPNASTGYIPWGHQESFVMERVLKASRILREAGVSTEYIIGMAEPKRFPYPLLRQQGKDGDWAPTRVDSHVMLNVREHKYRMEQDLWSRLPEAERTIEARRKFADMFEDMTFYTTVRATDTEYRIADMTNKEALNDLFHGFNARYRKDYDLPRLDPNVTADVDKYFEEFLMPTIGVNFARLHQKGLAHGFANIQNITGYGSIVDLDSVHGEPLGLGDKPVTGHEKALDIANILGTVWLSYQNVRLGGREVNPDDVPDKYIMEFMMHYFNETISLFEDREEARQYLSNLLMELCRLKLDEKYMAAHLKPKMQEYAAGCFFAYFHNASMLATRDATRRQLEDAQDAFVSVETQLLIRRKFVEHVKADKEQLMFALQAEISAQYVQGEGLDIVKILFTSSTPAARLMRASIEEKIAKELLADIEQQLYTDKVKELNLMDMNEIHILWQFHESIYKDSIFRAIGKVDNLVREKVLLDLYMDNCATLGYTVAESVLESVPNSKDQKTGVYGAQKEISFAEDELWTFSYGVPFYDIDDLLKKDVEVETEYIHNPNEEESRLRTERGMVTIAIDGKNQGYHLTQVVTDGKVSLIDLDNDKPDSLEFVFEEKNRPVYMLIVERNDKGHQRVTKLIDAEELVKALETFASFIDLDKAINEELFAVDDLT